MSCDQQVMLHDIVLDKRRFVHSWLVNGDLSLVEGEEQLCFFPRRYGCRVPLMAPHHIARVTVLDLLANIMFSLLEWKTNNWNNPS